MNRGTVRATKNARGFRNDIVLSGRVVEEPYHTYLASKWLFLSQQQLSVYVDVGLAYAGFAAPAVSVSVLVFTVCWCLQAALAAELALLLVCG